MYDIDSGSPLEWQMKVAKGRALRFFDVDFQFRHTAFRYWPREMVSGRNYLSQVAIYLLKMELVDFKKQMFMLPHRIRYSDQIKLITNPYTRNCDWSPMRKYVVVVTAIAIPRGSLVVYKDFTKQFLLPPPPAMTRPQVHLCLSNPCTLTPRQHHSLCWLVMEM